MQVAVIGGTRHVGPYIAHSLVEAGHEVSVYNRGLTKAHLSPGVEQVVVDRGVSGQLGAALRARQPEAVIDMIGYVVDQVEEVYAAIPHLDHYIFCSSTAVYGRIGSSTPEESASVIPDSDYTSGKAACEQFLMDHHRTNGFPATILRLAHPYGPGDNLLYTTGRESLFLDRMRRGRAILIPGSGNSRIHPVYVEDAARAFAHVLGRPECVGRIYNLAGEQILALNEYFASIARVLGVPLVARNVAHEFFRDRADLWSGWRRRFDFGYNWVRYESAFDTVALQATGFRCETDHDAGIELTLQWLESKGLVDLSSDEDEEDRLLAWQPGQADSSDSSSSNVRVP